MVPGVRCMIIRDNHSSQASSSVWFSITSNSGILRREMGDAAEPAGAKSDPYLFSNWHFEMA